MRALLLRAACLLALGTLPACSALGLADLPQSDCVNGGPGFCDSLGTSDPTGDDCQTWQCNRDTRHCEILPRDDDDDDAPSMMCAPAGTTPDCADDDGTNFPGNTETCDGHDDDCDGIADNGVIASSVASTATLMAPAATPQLIVTTQPDADEAFVLSRSATSSLQRVIVPADAAPDTDAITAPYAYLDVNGALSGIGMSTYALVLQRSETGGCQQWALTPLTATGATLRPVDESLLPTCPSTGISLPSVEGRAGSPLLVSWVEADPGRRECGATPAARVVVGTGQFDPRPTGNRIGDTTVSLGESNDFVPAAVAALAAPSGTGAFLVAYPTADRTIEVHRITVSATLEITDAGVVYTEPAGAMARQGVGLAVGQTSGDSTTVALSFYEGCVAMNPISVRWLTVTSTSVTAAGLTTGIGTGLVRNLVQVVHQPRSHDWLVTWRSSIGLSAQRVFDDGSLEGDPIDVLTGELQTYEVQARQAGPLFQATTVTGTNVQVLTFGCGAD